MGVLSRLFSSMRSAPAVTEKQGYYLPISGGWLSQEAGSLWNWWQCGYDVTAACGRSAMVEACIGAYAQTVAMCPGSHWRLNADGGKERVVNSALTRVLRKPNSYQSISDFLLNLTRSLYVDGNAYALALRNDRFEIVELHLMNPRACAVQLAEPFVAGGRSELFYSLGGNEVIERTMSAPLLVPQRDVLHLKLHTPRSTLKGESPLVAAFYDVAAASAIGQQQLAFYVNGARPSAVLATDQVLSIEQAKALRAAWDEQSKGLNAGGTPILSGGLKPHPLTISAKEAELAEVLKLTDQHIALAFRMPLQLLGIGPVPFASTEALMQFWLASGLGFCLNHIEEGIGNLFGLRGQPDEYLEFDTDALLRTALKDAVDAAARGVSGGIFSPNEARARFQLPKAESGDEPRLQAQVVPLSAADKIPTAPAAPASPAAPTDDEEPEPDERGSFDEDVSADFWRDLHELRARTDA